jgi:hypothetical protein
MTTHCVDDVLIQLIIQIIFHTDENLFGKMYNAVLRLQVVSKFRKRWQLLHIVVRAATSGSFGTKHKQVEGTTSLDASFNQE